MEQRKRLNSAFAHDLRTPLTVLKGYAEIFLQVLENLVSNAICYAKQNVDIHIFEIGNTINIAVSDDGTGFSDEGLENAAEPYCTGSNRNCEHFGFGLYICKLLCEHHGGGIEIKNTDKGAKIIVNFIKHIEQ